MQPEWRRQMLISLSKVLGTAVCVGLVVGGLALAGADALGLTGDDGSGPTARPESAATRSDRPSGTTSPPSAPPSPRATPEKSRTGTPTPAPGKTDAERRDGGQRDGGQRDGGQRDGKRRHQREHTRHQHTGGTLTLAASPHDVHEYGRVSLSGRYPGHNGATLQVQRAEPGWHDFPVTVTVRGGRFHTWVESGHPGANRFRVVDTRSGTTSAPVTVHVH